LVNIATPPPLEDLSCRKRLYPERLSVFRTVFLKHVSVMHISSAVINAGHGRGQGELCGVDFL
jgi:hypothetical protein